jgi:hypothetical protein
MTKSPREMILDRFAAASIDINRLAVEETSGPDGAGARVTGAVPNQAEVARANEVLNEAKAGGLNVKWKIECVPAGTPQDDDSVDEKIGNPPEPA